MAEKQQDEVVKAGKTAVIDFNESHDEWERYLHSPAAREAVMEGRRSALAEMERLKRPREAQSAQEGENDEAMEYDVIGLLAAEITGDPSLAVPMRRGTMQRVMTEMLERSRRTQKAEWREEEHPRDERGRFAEKPDAPPDAQDAEPQRVKEEDEGRLLSSDGSDLLRASDRTEALRSVDPHAPGEVWAEADRRFSRYGVVVIDPESKKVLLREPANHYDGFHWTFARGGADPGEHPVEAAKREGREELGYDLNMLAPLPGIFRGVNKKWASLYYVATPKGEPRQPSWETAQVRWVPYEEAIGLIKETQNIPGRERDLRVLDAVFSFLKIARKGSDDPEISFLL